MSNKKTWFITGASKGFGLSLVKQLLQQGYQVAATSRSMAGLTEAAGGETPDFLPLETDLTNEDSVRTAIETTLRRFGKIDVVVNNAGYGQAGAIEELTDREVRDNFDVNVFGVLNVLCSVLPYLRKQRSGHIFNISSIAGFISSFPGFGIYCSTKFALEGITGALAAEVKPFGIKVTSVAPGYFRTNFLDSGSLKVPANPIEAYTEVREVQQAHQDMINGNQPGDPEKAVAVIIRMANEQNPPLHLFLGQDAYDLAYQKIEAVKKDLETWKAISTATAFDEVTETVS